MTTMFWGLRLEPGKRYSTTVGRSFHVSMAALDCSSPSNDVEVSSVMLEEGETLVPFILCNLSKQKNMQCPLDLNFATGDRITFFCKGTGTIHLSGYVHEDDEFDNLLGEEEEEEEEEDEDAEEGIEEQDDEALLGKIKTLANGLKAKRTLGESAGSKSKKLKLAQPEGDSDEDLDDEDFDEDELENLGEESSVDDEESEDEDDSDDVEEEETPKSSPQKEKPKKQQNEKKSKVNGLPAANAQVSKKDKKKGDAKAQGATKEGVTSPQQKQQKNQAASQQLQKKTIEGGVNIKDTRIGNGAVCKPGQKATVYYIGRFKDNNKVFDSSRKGNGFSFTVGKGDVIKGWDVGVVGMKVGGKRTITCPPNMAYGQKGCPPTIPGNSTLTFEVELRNVA